MITTQESIDKLSDNDSERWLLQSMFLLEEANDIASTMLTVNDFRDERHKLVWKHQQRLHEKGKALDSLLLVASMKDELHHVENGKRVSDFDAVGGMAFMGTLLVDSVMPYHARYYADRVRKASVMRQLRQAAGVIAESVSNASMEDDIDELIGKSEQAIFEVTDASVAVDASKLSFRDEVFRTLDRIDNRRANGNADGLRTGLAELDKMTGGFRPGELIVIGARPGCGKSALAMTIAHHMTANENARVVLASLEMSAAELTERLLGSAARMNLYTLRNGTLTQDDRERLVEVAGNLSRCQLFIDDAPSRTVAQLASYVRMVKRRHKGLECVIVDYIQLISPENARDPRQEQVAKISRKLKTLARELKVPIICLAQLNRQADDPSKPPRLSQLRESGAIEQDADLVIFIHRPEAAKNDSDVKDCEEAELHVAKQRNGPTGVVKVGWFRRWCRFEPIEDRWEERKDTAFDDWNK